MYRYMLLTFEKLVPRVFLIDENAFGLETGDSECITKIP
jgi:hypothetical protein